MPSKEFTVLIENRPSMLGKVCQALADQEVNILAIESFPTRGKFVTRFIVDNPDTAKTVKVAQRQLRHADSRVTLDHYAHLIDSSHREAVERAAAFLDRCGPKIEGSVN